MADRYPIVVINGEFKELPSGDTIPAAVVPSTFLGLTDTPSAYTSQALKAVRVNAGESALEFYTPSSGITIGSTAITSGTDGRVLFQNAGVVSQDSGLLYDASTDSLTVGSGTLRMPNSSSVFLLATPHASYTGTQNVFIGASAGANNTAFHSNVYIGDNAGSNTSGDAYFNVFIGRGSGQNTQGRENVFLGHNTGNANTTGAANVFVGSGTGASNTTGVNNVIIGKSAGAAYNGNNALFVGNSAGLNVTSGVQNTLIGSAAGSGITSGGTNTALGYEAGGASLTGTHESCVFIGNLAGKSSTGNYNVVIGGNAGTGGISGRGNIIMGYRAAYSLTTGALNVIIGTNEGSSSITTGEGNVFLGAGAGSQETGSNRLYIHNSNTTTPLIYGEFSTPLLRVHGNLCGRTTSGAQITAEYDGSNYGTWTVGSTGINTFNAVGSGAKFVFSDAIEINGSLTLSAQNIITDTTTGMKIGTGTTQKLGFFNATPVTQRANIGQLTDLTGGTIVTTLQDCDSGGTADPATINDNFAGVLSKINKLEAALKDLGFSA